MSLQGKTRRNRALLNKGFPLRKLRRTLIEWGRKNYSEFPWRSTTNCFHALLAEVMLQRTRAEQVVPVFSEFVARYSSVQDAAEEDPEKIRAMMSSLGLRWRAEKIVELIRVLEANNGRVPCSFEELINLPGVGEYAASSYLSLHSNVRAPIVDSNVVRIWKRVFCLETDTDVRRKRRFLDLVDEITPKNDFKDFNYAVLDLTRKVCRPKPLHDICPIASLCGYYERGCK